MAPALFVLAAFVAAGLFGYWAGFNAGVAETQRRWAGALRKAQG